MKSHFLHNLSSSVFVQIANVGINLFSVPFILGLLGLQQFGLIAFYVSLQAVFSILDAGLSPLVIRESARAEASTQDQRKDYEILKSAIRDVFFIVGIIGSYLIYINSPLIASQWLDDLTQTAFEPHHIIQLISFIVFFRWISGFYRALFIGYQEILKLNIITLIISVIKFIGVIPFLKYTNGDAQLYFIYQLGCGVLELMALFFISSTFAPVVLAHFSLRQKYLALREKYSFGLFAGASTLLWLVMTQGDKLFVLKTMGIDQFSVFSLGVMGASVLLFISSPLSNTVIPKLIEINARSDFRRFFYVTLTLATICVVSVSSIFVMASEEILLLWTRDAGVAARAHLVFAFYVIGNSLAVLSSFAYFIQSAIGSLRLHFYGSILVLFLFFGGAYFLADIFGADGVAYAWALSQIFGFFIWNGVVYARFLSGFYLRWIFRCFLPVVLISIISSSIFTFLGGALSKSLLFVPILVTSVFVSLSLGYLACFGSTFKPVEELRGS